METADCYDDTIIEYPKEQGTKVQKLTNTCIFLKVLIWTVQFSTYTYNSF